MTLPCALQEAAKAEAQALADTAAVGGEASEGEARDLAAATERQEAVCRSLLHELRFKKHAALEAGALPLCARTRSLTCGTDWPHVACVTTDRYSATVFLRVCMVHMWLLETCYCRDLPIACLNAACSACNPVTDTTNG